MLLIFQLMCTAIENMFFFGRVHLYLNDTATTRNNRSGVMQTEIYKKYQVNPVIMDEDEKL